MNDRYIVATSDSCMKLTSCFDTPLTKASIPSFRCDLGMMICAYKCQALAAGSFGVFVCSTRLRSNSTWHTLIYIGSVNKRQDSHTNLIPHTNNCDMMDFNLTVLQSTSCMIL